MILFGNTIIREVCSFSVSGYQNNKSHETKLNIDKKQISITTGEIIQFIAFEIFFNNILYVSYMVMVLMFFIILYFILKLNILISAKLKYLFTRV